MPRSLAFQIVKSPEGSRLRAGESFLLSGPQILIGRLPPADLCLPDRSVSRQHALLVEEAAGWRLDNLSTNNGLFIDGARVAPGERVLLSASSASLQIGAVVLSIEPNMETEPFDLPLSVPHAPATPPAPQDALLTIERDGDNASVWWRGKLIPMKPTSAVILHILAAQAGRVVHEWDIFDALGRDCDLPQAISAIRRPLRALITSGELDADTLADLIAQVSVEDEDQRAPDQLARRLISSRRGQGYALLLPAHVVHTSEAG